MKKEKKKERKKGKKKEKKTYSFCPIQFTLLRKIARTTTRFRLI